MGAANLPFGRTQVTVTEVRQNIDEASARKELQEVDVSDPDESLDQFLKGIPSLLNWLDEHGRDYPWRRTTDPWHIYAAEILLQRTRSDAVASIYTEFFETFPDPEAILEKDEETLRDLVHPLGFVNHRVRTLHEAAELCVHRHDGTVPADIEELQRPWRVGRYTARACLIFAFQKPLALVDTNTARVTGRVFDYPLPTQPHKSDQMYRFLDALVPADPDLARAFNLALLDLGALRCTEDSPDCGNCPLVKSCIYAKSHSDSGTL